MEQLILRLEWRHLSWVLLGRHLHHEPFIIQIEFEIPKISGARHHIAIIIILKLIHAIYVDLGYPPVFK